MPIKPKNKDRYPDNWSTEVVPRIRKRSGDRCEKCGVGNHAVGYRDEKGNFIPLSGSVIYEDYGAGIDPYTGKLADMKTARQLAEFNTTNDEYGYQYIVIVLTVAHLDHNPENCSDSNLRHWCQKCHNRYDTQHRKGTIRKGKLKGQLTLQLNEGKENNDS